APPVYEMSVVVHAPKSSLTRGSALADDSPRTRASNGPVSNVDSPQARPTEQSTGVTVYLRSFVVIPSRLEVMTPSQRLPLSEMALMPPRGTDSSTVSLEPAPGIFAERVTSIDSPGPKLAFDRLRFTCGGGLCADSRDSWITGGSSPGSVGSPVGSWNLRRKPDWPPPSATFTRMWLSPGGSVTAAVFCSSRACP